MIYPSDFSIFEDHRLGSLMSKLFVFNLEFCKEKSWF